MEAMFDIVKHHNKIQGLPKEVMFVDINNPQHTYDNVFRVVVQSTINLEQHHYYGNFSETGELLSFIRFKFWMDNDINQECWTAGVMWRNKNAPMTYTHGQRYFPDELIDVHNHAVSVAENRGIKIGYTLSPNARPGSWIRFPAEISGSTESGQSILMHGPMRYRSELVEEIVGGKLSTHEKFVNHISNIALSTNQCIYRFTKIE